MLSLPDLRPVVEQQQGWQRPGPSADGGVPEVGGVAILEIELSVVCNPAPLAGLDDRVTPGRLLLFGPWEVSRRSRSGRWGSAPPVALPPRGRGRRR